MALSATRLVGSRVLVKGTDEAGTEGSTVLDSTQWDEVNAQKQLVAATDEYDKAVDEFFAPLLQAFEAVEKANAAPEPDSVTFVVLEEKVDGTPAKPGRVVQLNHDSIVLRMIEQGDTSRLIWVGDSLEIAAR